MSAAVRGADWGRSAPDNARPNSDQLRTKIGHKMLNVYVAGPYKSETPEGIKKNIANAQAIGVAIWQIGGHAVVPHVMSLGVDLYFPEQFWLREGLYRLAQCDALIRLPGSEESLGTEREWELAGQCGLVRFDAYAIDPNPLVSLPQDLRYLIAGIGL